nr:unnamed protein product [Spirometra erinaceieuropaei]
MEEEENNQLAFVDVLICRKGCGGLKTNVFRKATNTMQVLNFHSNHPISRKRSCVRTLYRRVETHFSEPEDKIAEPQYLRRVFKASGYPRNFVNRCIHKRDERPNCTDPKFWRALLNVKNVSEALGRLLSPVGDLAIETIELLLQSKYDETENRLGHALVLQLLKLCLRTYFTFDGTIYEQVKGTPMGSPISGFIAEVVLQRLESLVFQHYRPKFWARYVDDTFVVIERR